MKTLKKLSVFSLASVSLLALGACGQGPKYERGDDEEIYAEVLGPYEKLAAEAKKIKDDDARFVKYAEAEANLLNSGAFIPTTTQGGNYAITRVAPRTVPYAKWGNDDDRLKTMVVVDGTDFIKKETRAALLAAWQLARAGGAEYNPKLILTAAGYTQFKNTYQTTYQTAPATLDILNTSEQSDTEVLVNCIDGLLEYDNLGILRGNLAITHASGLPYELSEDGKTYTFTIRDDAKWFTANGDVYGDVTGDDFVASFQHMLDAQAGLEFLVDGVVKGASEYLSGEGKFEDVGVAADGKKFSITLIEPESFFPSRLTYSCFMPMNRAFFESKGGVFGIKEFAEASASESYKYGNVADNGNMIYNGAFLPSNIVEKSNITLARNANYFNNAKNNFNELKWVYDDGSQPDNLYTAACNGTYAGIGLGVASGLLAKAKADGNFDKFGYVADTTTTTFLCGFNLNRGTFETGSVKTTQSGQEQIDAHNAMQNINFRKALQYGWDRATWNAISVGEELGALSIRNMYTDPNFLTLGKDVTGADGHVFKQGQTYGDLVQYFTDKLGMGIKVADSQEGWYNAAKAREFMAKAKEELEAANQWHGKVKLDVTYYGASKAQVANAEGYKKLIEGILGDFVEVCLNNAETTADFYACGYRAKNGESGNFDVFFGSGWGPDYGDPSTYLDTFLGGGAGYMTKIVGLF